ncbi:hypothetical protein F5X98DRAFT_348416 [Xylaria grammica]|nr:hypothetical protein F5X98DRAFT_348416 [Xylaria grammica]
MHSFVNAAWPHATHEILTYEQEDLQKHARIRVLEANFTESGRHPKVEIVEKTDRQLSRSSQASTRCYLRLVLVTRSWRFSNTSNAKIPHYNISQKSFTDILKVQGLTGFFRQTRVDVAGLFRIPISHPQKPGSNDSEFFAVIQDAFLGLWAKYDYENKRWEGIWIVAETSLNLDAIAGEMVGFIKSKIFLYLLAAKYNVDFIALRSGELPRQIAEIERHSGHHDVVLRRVPAIYEKLEVISADATSAANLVSYFKVIISYLAEEILQHVEETWVDDAGQAKDAKQHVAYLRQRVKSLSAYLSYLERRAERQVAATFHLVNQANASTNLAVAHDTKILAVASKRDSSSMKILAAVTTTFLPGAFVATLFSMDMFNWFAGADMPVVSGRFWIYWVITIPLTLVTVGIWLAWEFWVVRRQRRLWKTGDSD